MVSNFHVQSDLCISVLEVYKYNTFVVSLRINNTFDFSLWISKLQYIYRVATLESFSDNNILSEINICILRCLLELDSEATENALETFSVPEIYEITYKTELF